MPAGYKPRQNSSYGGRKKKAPVKGPPPVPKIYRSRLAPMGVKEGSIADHKDPNKEEERKFDGSRAFTIKDLNDVAIMGSKKWANDYGIKYPHLKEAIRELPVDRAIFDTEFCFFEKGTDIDHFYNAVANPETAKKEGIRLYGKPLEPKLVIFDVLYVDNDDLQQIPLEDRKEILTTIIPKDTEYIIVPKEVRGIKAKEKQAADLEKKGREGTVAKDINSPYRQGEETPEWVKIKNWKNDEFVIFGWTKGEGARASTFGAAIVAQYGKDGKLHYVGKVAGFKQNELTTKLQEMKKNQVKTLPPVLDIPNDVLSEAQGWVDFKKMVPIQVKFLGRNAKSGVLRMPDFMHDRPDKPYKQCKMPEARGKSI